MRHRPDFESFCRLANEYTMIPVYRQLLSDTLTPVNAYARLGAGDWSFLFESVIGGEKVGRYSFLGGWPFLRFEAYGHSVRVHEPDCEGEFQSPDPLVDLGRLIARYRAPHFADLPRFTGGAVGYVAYDAVRYWERLPNPPHDDRRLPDLCFGFFDQMVLFDHITKVVSVVVLAHVDRADLQACYRRAADRVDQIVEKLSHGRDDLDIADIRMDGDTSRTFESNFTPDRFAAAVEKCKAYIRAGDFFQVVISQRLMTKTTAGPLDIYRTLRVVNPSPFMVYLPTPTVTLIASSPEIMVRVENGRITTRPLAGTRRRGQTEDEDRRLAEELLADPKERAEHIMLVDLGRNDVGRVSKFNTVRLSDVMTVERYSHVMHITSNVAGELRDRLTPLDALRACLPAGTVSGAPKVRAMEVIDEIEPHRRGPYAGAIGYVDFTGNMDTCIALRTLVMIGQTAYIQAGAGIVYDSDPASEYQETLNKARGLLTAVEVTELRLQDDQRKLPTSSSNDE
jgi:anthranilate synthase component 1